MSNRGLNTLRNAVSKSNDLMVNDWVKDCVYLVQVGQSYWAAPLITLLGHFLGYVWAWDIFGLLV